MKTLREELIRRSAIEQQMKDLLDAAALPQGEDMIGAANLGRAWLFAALYDGNEKSKARYDGPMAGLIAALEARIGRVNDGQ